jgi:hypothetical protein
MTNRELYTATINALRNYNTDEANGLIAEFENAIAKLDATNEKRKAASAVKAAEKQAEKEPVREALFAVMGGEDAPMTASMLIEAAGLDIKPASVPSLMRPLIEAGRVAKVDVKITGKGKQRGYVRT